MAEPGDGDVCNFFRKPSAKKQFRRPAVQPDEDDGDNAAEPIIPKQKKPNVSGNALYFSSSSREGKDPTLFHFDSSKEVQVQHDNRATASLETETDFSRDSRAIRERVLKQAENTLRGKSKASGGDDEKLYKGIHGYTDYKAGFRREQTIAGEKAGGAHGPLRASANIRTSARFDYQPDICKDYKETGYCGYGDSCKFMHDRGDYKSGWQLEREWTEAEKMKKMSGDGAGSDDEDDGDDETLPFACFICRQPFQDPVVTKCKHYFCEHCALRENLIYVEEPKEILNKEVRRLRNREIPMIMVKWKNHEIDEAK